MIKPHYKLNEVQELIRKDNFDMYSTVYEGLFDLGFQRIDVKEYYLRHITIRDFDKQMCQSNGGVWQNGKCSK